MVSGNVIPLKIKPAPLKVSVVSVTSPFVAIRVPVWSALVVPRLTVPKLKLDGVTESCPTTAKFTPILFKPEITTCWLTGEKTNPVLPGVTV